MFFEALCAGFKIRNCTESTDLGLLDSKDASRNLCLIGILTISECFPVQRNLHLQAPLWNWWP